MMGGGGSSWSTQICLDLKIPLWGGVGQPKSAQIKFSHLTSLSTSSRLNDSQVKCSLYKGGATLQIAPIKYWGVNYVKANL